MPEFVSFGVGYSFTAGSDPTNTRGTTITASGSTHTKGSWVQLVAATEKDASWVMIELLQASTVGLYMVDIGIGAAAEQVIIPNLFASSPRTTTSIGPYLFPVFIPAGSRITARCQSSVASAAIDIAIQFFSGNTKHGGSGPSFVSAYGANTATTLGTNVDPGAVAHTDSSWVQVVAATERVHNWILISASIGDRAVAANSTWLLDIGIGSATEQEIISDFYYVVDITADSCRDTARYFPYYIPAGSRLTARVRGSNTTDSDRDVWLVIYGV